MVLIGHCVAVCTRRCLRCHRCRLRPRNPEESLLYQVVTGELETFLAAQQDNERPVPGFIEQENRLVHLVHEMMAGGKEGIAAALKLANEYLQTTYPKIPALVLEDFRYISHTPDQRTIHFVPTPPAESDDRDPILKWMAPKPQFSVAVEYITGSTPKITVRNPPQ